MNAITAPRASVADFYSHAAAWRALLGKSPTAFEAATGAALWRAYVACQQAPERFKAVSAATGSGKTIGAVALMAHIFPAASAIVIREVSEGFKAFEHLRQLIGADHVAIAASAESARRFEEENKGLKFPRFTDAQIKAAPVLVCTHKRWKNEIEAGTDRGVRLCNGVQRDLVVIDEEPELERVYVARPEDVSALASILSDVVTADEARAFGFTIAHHAASALHAIHNRMRSVKDNTTLAALTAQGDLVDSKETSTIRALTRRDVYNRLGHLDEHERVALADDMDVVIQFLQAACDGRVFFSKGSRSEFFAYSYAIPPQRNTIILDGTADLNGLYAVGQSLVTVPVPQADYSAVELNYVALPQEFSGLTYWDRSNVSRVRQAAPFMAWFHDQVIACTEPGEHVLVYAPQALINTDTHMRYDESGKDDPSVTLWSGRTIHWQHFGSGRGTNQYKDCTVFFQLRAFYKPKGAIIAKTLSHAGEQPSPTSFRKLSTGTTTDARYIDVRDTLIACDTKQNAARVCIRKLDDQGRAAKARLYFVSDNLTQIERYQEQMFPGAPRVSLKADPKRDLANATGPARLMHLLSVSDDTIIVWAALPGLTGIHGPDLAPAWGSPKVQAVARVRGWSKVTRRDAGMPGKGFALVRAS